MVVHDRGANDIWQVSPRRYSVNSDLFLSVALAAILDGRKQTSVYERRGVQVSGVEEVSAQVGIQMRGHDIYLKLMYMYQYTRIFDHKCHNPCFSVVLSGEVIYMFTIFTNGQ